LIVFDLLSKFSNMKKRKVSFKSVAIYCHHKPAKEKVESAFLRELL